MKFSCDKCNTSYVIADEKVGRRLKVRCKKCGNIILIHGRTATVPPASAVDESEVTQRVVTSAPAAVDSEANPSAGNEAKAGNAGGGLLQGLSFDDEKTVQYDPSELLGKTEEKPGEKSADLEGEEDLSEEETRVFDVERLRELMEEREIAAAEKRERPAAGMPGFAVQPPRPASEPVWYLAIGGRQVGPLPIDDVKDKMKKGEVELTTYVWRSGFKDWTYVSGVPELERLYREAGPKEGVGKAGGESAAGPVVAKIKISERHPLTTGRMYGGVAAGQAVDEPFAQEGKLQEKQDGAIEVKVGGQRAVHTPSPQRKRKATVVEFDLSELASLAKKEVEEEENRRRR